nr:uncharacterized protein LOC108124887 isoform X1 [Drosophila bipectinata]
MAEIDDVFNMLGFGRMQRTIFVGCLMMQIWFTTEQLGVGIVLMAAACDLDMDDYKLAWFSALTFAVQILAFIFWGVLVDALGRRKIIMYTGVTSVACSILSAGMPEFLSFSALRIVCSAFGACNFVDDVHGGVYETVVATKGPEFPKLRCGDQLHPCAE